MAHRKTRLGKMWGYSYRIKRVPSGACAFDWSVRIPKGEIAGGSLPASDLRDAERQVKEYIKTNLQGR